MDFRINFFYIQENNTLTLHLLPSPNFSTKDSFKCAAMYQNIPIRFRLENISEAV